MNGSAVISKCGQYRYLLTREWDAELPTLAYIMLNPSIANASIDDPTITRCVERARRLGYGKIRVANLFAYRATDPICLRRYPEPVGPLNDAVLKMVARHVSCVVAAWGVHGQLFNRADTVMKMLDCELHCLGTTGKGMPRHPLYVPYDQPLETFPK